MEVSRRVVLTGAVALATVFAVASAGRMLDRQSFEPPFKTYDSQGRRRIDNYIYGGDTDVNENFIRMTPDRAVRGAVGWSPADEARLIFRLPTSCHVALWSCVLAPCARRWP